MYYKMGKNSDGLEIVRAMRGSVKVETVNREVENALYTTGKMTVDLADGEHS